MFIKQRTLKKVVSLTGKGVHSGREVTITFHPSAPDTGIVFRRTDLQPMVSIPALHRYVTDTRMNTCLSHQGINIATVEHLLSAFAGLGIDNVLIDIDGSEVPVFDGSSMPFVKLLHTAEIDIQTSNKLFLKIKQPVQIQEGDKQASLEPFSGFKLSLSIDFDHPVIHQSQQMLDFNLTQISYVDAISQARTFGFLSEYEYLKSKNLALGAGLDNTVVLDENTVLNPEGLRYPDEFIRHKALDVLGDLQLIGYTLFGEFKAHKPGHALNHRLREALFSQTCAWELIPLPENQPMPISFAYLHTNG